MEIILNKIAIWKAHGSAKLTKRPAPRGTRYINPGEVIYKNANDKLIVRYAKDYKEGEIEFSLFVRTFCDDEKAVEKALDAVAKRLEKSYILEATYNSSFSAFTYTDYVFDEETKGIK